MGFAQSWLAVRGKPPAAVLAELQLRATGEPGSEGETPIVGATADAGWYLVVADGAEHRLVDRAVIARLSAGCEVLTCTVEEHVMFSRASGWRDGREVWAVTHRGEDGPTGIDETGALPPEYPAIRDALVARQAAEGGADADVDYLFEIPVVLVQQSTGYRHDEPNPALEAAGYETLEPLAGEPAKRSWIGRLLGR